MTLDSFFLCSLNDFHSNRGSTILIILYYQRGSDWYNEYKNCSVYIFKGVEKKLLSSDNLLIRQYFTRTENMNFIVILFCTMFTFFVEFAVSFKLSRIKRSTDVPSRCLQSPETGECRAAFENYYYNPSSGECETFIYGGCQGNENNFWDIKDCEAVCKGILRDDVDVDNEIWESMQALVEDKDDCEYPPETGDCRDLVTHYYYNGVKCETFVYGGCGGNPNNFRTEEECMKRCGPKSENEEEDNEI